MSRNPKAREAGDRGDQSAAAALEELASQHDRMESARLAASESCDHARHRLVAAQHRGDPQLILAGHRELESALKALRRSSIACERTRRAVLGEKEQVERPGGGAGRPRG